MACDWKDRLFTLLLYAGISRKGNRSIAKCLQIVLLIFYVVCIGISV